MMKKHAPFLAINFHAEDKKTDKGTENQTNLKLNQ